jgi:hypothetical protein
MATQIDYYSLSQLLKKYGDIYPQTILNVRNIFMFINQLIHDSNNRQYIIDGTHEEPGRENITDGYEQWKIYAEEIRGWEVGSLGHAEHCVSTFRGYNYRFKNHFFEDMTNIITPLSFLMRRLKDDLECSIYDELKYLEEKPLNIEAFITGYYEGKLIF